MSGCGSEPAKPVQQDVPAAQPDQAQAPQPAPVFPQYGASYYNDVYKYLAQLKQTNPTFSYRSSEAPDIEPSIPMSQGAFELICYGAYNGKISIAEGDATLGSCDRWLIPGLSPVTRGNDIFYYDPLTGAIDTGKPEVAYVAALLGQSAPNGMPAPMNIEHKLLQVSEDFGFAVRTAFEDQQSSDWTNFQPALASELKTFFERSSDVCYATDNEGQDLFNRMKMLLANRESYGTVWSSIFKNSETKIAENHAWIVPMLEAGAISQMMFDTPKSKLRGLENRNELLKQATDAYNKARQLCPTCLPDINDAQAASCIRELDPDTMAQWDAPTLVAWQLLRIAEILEGGGGTRDAGTDAGPVDAGPVDAGPVDASPPDIVSERVISNPWAGSADAGSK
jgi:hypothetical protein